MLRDRVLKVLRKHYYKFLHILTNRYSIMRLIIWWIKSKCSRFFKDNVLYYWSTILNICNKYRAQWLARWTTVLMVQSSNPLVGECLFPSVIYELLSKIHCIIQWVVLLSEFRRRHKWPFSVSQNLSRRPFWKYCRQTICSAPHVKK